MPLECKYLVDNADVVCKVKVVEVKEEQVTREDGLEVLLKLPALPKITRNRAWLETLSAIKGSPPKKIEVAYPKSGGTGPFYTELSAGEVCVVFLKGNSSPYTFFDLTNGKMEALPIEIPYKLGDAPQDKLFTELLASAKIEEGARQIQAIEQLVHLGDRRAVPLLKRLSASSDVVLKGEALISRVKIGDAPTVEELIGFLKRSPNEFSREASGKKYGTTRYSVLHLQGRLLYMIECSVKRADGDRPAQRLKNFDYHEFYRQASLCEIFSYKGEGIATGFARRSMESTLRTLEEQNNPPPPAVRPASQR